MAMAKGGNQREDRKNDGAAANQAEQRVRIHASAEAQRDGQDHANSTRNKLVPERREGLAVLGEDDQFSNTASQECQSPHIANPCNRGDEDGGDTREEHQSCAQCVWCARFFRRAFHCYVLPHEYASDNEECSCGIRDDLVICADPENRHQGIGQSRQAAQEYWAEYISGLNWGGFWCRHNFYSTAHRTNRHFARVNHISCGGESATRPNP